MTAPDDRAIRQWGLANGYKCSTGRLSQSLRYAWSVAQDHLDPVDPDPSPSAVEPGTDAPVFRLVVELPGAEDLNDDVSAQLLEAVWTIFHAGRAAERRDLLAQLGGTA